MALTIEHGREGIVGVPWPLEYRGFASASNNGLYR